ncbi:hypothetical protein IU433_17535 [Nocardia puris]|nr:hypothetical protein [Nocardia puris]MBF6212247.1 hypothetical protein [Nocardia puris]MBF6370147.1 hypothetical protein [Nocardia puris]MBF6460836.1 hypothetical protein [Nocardia puris]
MATSEQRVRERKTRKLETQTAEQNGKSARGRDRKIARDIPASWRCEGQLSLFDTEQDRV